MKPFFVFGLLVSLAAVSFSKQRDWHFGPYIGFDSQYGFVKADSETFNPVNGRLRLGSYIYKTVGPEIVWGGISLHDDEKFNMELGIDESFAFNIRWESPAEKNRGLSAYFLTGYVTNSVQILNPQGDTVKENYTGANLGIGFKQKYFGWLGIYGEYNYQYFKDDVRISGIAFGMQFEF